MSEVGLVLRTWLRLFCELSAPLAGALIGDSDDDEGRKRKEDKEGGSSGEGGKERKECGVINTQHLLQIT